MTTTPAPGADKATDELLPCPFCGESATLSENEKHAICLSCKTTPWIFVENWNRRAAAGAPVQSQPQGQIISDELIDAIEKQLRVAGQPEIALPHRHAFARMVEADVLAHLAAPAVEVARPDLAKLEKWSYSFGMGVMVPNSPQPRRQFYAVEDVDALLSQAPDQTTGEKK